MHRQLREAFMFLFGLCVCVCVRARACVCFNILNGKLVLVTWYFSYRFWSRSLEPMGWTLV